MRLLERRIERSVSLPVCRRRTAGLLLEDSPEVGGIGVSNLLGDLIDPKGRVLQKLYCGLYADLFQVFPRGYVKFLVEGADQL